MNIGAVLRQSDMNVDLLGKPAFLSDVKYGSLFYTEIERRIFPCLKAFIVLNETEIVDYTVAIKPSERDRTHLPRLVEERNATTRPVYCVANTSFRPVISEATMLMELGYWPKPGDVIESQEATFLTVKSGRMPHKLMYLNISTGELHFAQPKAPLLYVMEWKIALDQPDGEQTLIHFPLGNPALLRSAALQ